MIQLIAHPLNRYVCSRSKKILQLLLIVVVVALWTITSSVVTAADATPWGKAVAPGGKTLWGFITFPYDLTLDAVEMTNRVARENGNLYVIHRDNGIPWQEALENRSFPKKVRKEWDDYVRRKPKGVKVYLALAPLAEDRKSLIHASEGSETPDSFFRQALDSANVKIAYLNYVRRAIETFHPDYLNIGIEAGEMAARDPYNWKHFVRLFEYVSSFIRKEYPTIRFGISFGLQSLMEPEVERRARVVIDKSDFLCLSFYPFLSSLSEAFGAAPLPPPPEQWRKPIRWLEKFSSIKPVAFCETAYTTRSGRLQEFRLGWEGSEALQEAYVKDLAVFANKDNYQFVTWFAPVDYEALSKKIKGDREGIHLIWQNVGFLDQHLRPKLALQAWRTTVAGKIPVIDGASQSVQVSALAKKVVIDFKGPGDRFVAPPDNQISFEESGPGGSDAMRWSFDYKDERFQWVTWEFKPGMITGTSRLNLMVRSNQEGPLLIQLEEKDGEAFYYALIVKKEWETVGIPYENMQLDGAKQRNGRLEPDKVVKLLLADAGAVTEGASGSRIFWFTQWSFD